MKHVKENDLAHGEFGIWAESIGMDDSIVRKFIRIAEELGENRYTYTEMGMNALYLIATIPPEQREQAHVTEKGEEKKPEEMTVRELRELKKQLRAEKAERERLEQVNEELAKVADKPPEVVTEYVEVKDEEAERKVQRYEE